MALTLISSMFKALTSNMMVCDQYFPYIYYFSTPISSSVKLWPNCPSACTSFSTRKTLKLYSSMYYLVIIILILIYQQMRGMTVMTFCAKTTWEIVIILPPSKVSKLHLPKNGQWLWFSVSIQR